METSRINMSLPKKLLADLSLEICPGPWSRFITKAVERLLREKRDQRLAAEYQEAAGAAHARHLTAFLHVFQNLANHIPADMGTPVFQLGQGKGGFESPDRGFHEFGLGTPGAFGFTDPGFKLPAGAPDKENYMRIRFKIFVFQESSKAPP